MNVLLMNQRAESALEFCAFAYLNGHKFFCDWKKRGVLIAKGIDSTALNGQPESIIQRDSMSEHLMLIGHGSIQMVIADDCEIALNASHDPKTIMSIGVCSRYDALWYVATQCPETVVVTRAKMFPVLQDAIHTHERVPATLHRELRALALEDVANYHNAAAQIVRSGH